ncbi:major facilitator superfamily MFS_1 [Gloeothece citriformis PCC 7424]|uniref:Major facilitator superfamily MFS_1 n=1 Tax=Gloeothece citriformis (strain PCC 7424) TaxID=65393 RepID=B7KF66_GLOC7|nr:glycoside-pentoside-hexuronide (GPH):cation symporter [Gloeothece citriformis]ACK71782.1 major facilitator superfamily MFS_1 [Gloeothece citriformis PCC 7424]
MNSFTTQRSKVDSPEGLDLKTKLAYGVGELSNALPSNISIFFFLFFLTNVAGLNAGLVANIVLVSKLWDAINDPLIGWFSDRIRSPFGRRYPLMVLGAIPLGFFFALIWFVPSVPNQNLLFFYYLIVGFFYDISFTSVVLPLNTLASELTQKYHERTTLVSFKSAFAIGGSIFSLILAQLIFSFIDDKKQQFLTLGVTAGIIAIAVIYLCVAGTYHRYQLIQKTRPALSASPPDLPFWQQLKIVFSNRPFLFVMGIYLCSWLSLQTVGVILSYFVINWMGLPETHFTQMALAVQGTALGMMFVWSFLSRKIGKKEIFCLAIPVTVIAITGLFFLQPGQIVLMYLIGVMAGLGLSAAYIVPWSMLPDVVDLDELNTGYRREGVFYGFMVQLQKLGIALGLFLVGKILEASGYISTTSEQSNIVQPESALWAIRLIIAPIPALLLIIALVLAFFYPITKSVHDKILLQLFEKRKTLT